MSRQALSLVSNNNTPELVAYFQRLERIPMLSYQEEHDLALRYQATQDPALAQQLLLPHLKYVIRVARDYQGYGLHLADLVQEGTLGLMKAVKRFDPAHGVRLVTFAMHWIKAEITDYILKNWRIVRVVTTKAQKKLFFNLRRMKKGLNWLTRQEVAQVADDLGVSQSTVLEMESRLYGQDISFDRNGDDDDDHESLFAPSDYLLADGRQEPMQQLQHRARLGEGSDLKEALLQLDDRNRTILETRWLQEPKRSLKELAEEFGVSIERIRQLEQRAMKQLQQIMAQATD